mmetsp:Transcript_51451/g.171720  ORF Transcript_51451/g.171720 Transcript_51451/m.171720 type:complete len:218 (+) Transcript_51451:105-758(+)
MRPRALRVFCVGRATSRRSACFGQASNGCASRRLCAWLTRDRCCYCATASRSLCTRRVRFCLARSRVPPSKALRRRSASSASAPSLPSTAAATCAGHRRRSRTTTPIAAPARRHYLPSTSAVALAGAPPRRARHPPFSWHAFMRASLCRPRTRSARSHARWRLPRSGARALRKERRSSSMWCLAAGETSCPTTTGSVFRVCVSSDSPRETRLRGAED